MLPYGGTQKRGYSSPTNSPIMPGEDENKMEIPEGCD